MNPSGGIGYHFAAFWYASRLWKPFREDLARELALRISAPAETIDLVIVGPSGGYCLDPDFLKKFRSVVAVDIDPFAKRVLKKRFAGKVRFLRRDFFKELEARDWDLARWCEAIGAPVGSMVLFSNLLGQLGFLFDEVRMRAMEAGLSRALSGDVPWISFHDRFSAKVGATPRVELRFDERPSSEQLARAWNVDVKELVEHEIGEWITQSHGAFTYLPWRLDSRRTQLIEISSRVRR